MDSSRSFHVHLDLIGGLAGDMFIAAAIDAGLVDEHELGEAMSQLGLGTIKVLANKVMRYGIEATHVSFMGWDASQERDHRHLSEIEAMIEESGLDEAVKRRALSMFRALGEVEAETHNIPLERVHFHEIGAIDSILDFIGSAYIIEHSGASWSAGEVPVGQGVVQMSHGPMPAMAPATAKLLVGFSLKPSEAHAELVTPTGATILKELGVSTPGLSVGGVLQGAGFGAGTRELERIANVARMTVYEHKRQEVSIFQSDTIFSIEADLDDETPEVLAHAERALLKAGALDVTRHAVTMKKGRLGTRLGVLCQPSDAERLAALVFEQTSTFGVRVRELSRWILSRELTSVQTRYGEVAVKVGRIGDRVVTVSAEDDACAELAARHGVSPQRVHAAVRAASEAAWEA